MRVLLANDRTQTQHKSRSLAGSNKSPGSGNEKPRPGEEKAGALRDGRRRGAPGGILPSKLTQYSLGSIS